MWKLWKTDEKRANTERIDALERDLRLIRLEWDDVLDKIIRKVNRITKNRSVLEALESDNGTAEPSPQESGATRGHLLTPHQMQAQQAILRRRSGG